MPKFFQMDSRVTFAGKPAQSDASASTSQILAGQAKPQMALTVSIVPVHSAVGLPPVPVDRDELELVAPVPP
jgi:hypothetical protein